MRILLGSTPLSLLLLAGCYSGGPLDAQTHTTPPPAGPSGPDAGAAVDAGPNGLPCDVLALLRNYCVACHSSPPVGGAPMPLETYADLIAPAPTDPTRSVAQMCVARMQGTTRPMPPAGSSPTAQEVAAFASWVAAAAPRGSCSADAGSPYDTPVQCTSARTYAPSGDGNAMMEPGGACISCHARGDGPGFRLGGTVYPTAHEPDRCYGADVSSATVEITDANGNVLSMGINSAGNFDSSSLDAIAQGLAFPFTATVFYAGRSRAMSAPQTSGDCNSCHTESGANGAPGRIMLP